MKYIIGFVIVFISIGFAVSPVKIARVKYSGGGDWYVSPTSLPNLIKFCNKELNTAIFPEEDIVELSSPEIFNYPFLYLTGHGNIILSDYEGSNLRKYLEAGGFLCINDSYGMDQFIRLELNKVFPDKELKEVPFSHSIYNVKYDFSEGLPKIHQHDGKQPRGYGYFIDGRLAVFYNHECDLGDGWEDKAVHKDSEEARLKALQMGANILNYAFIGK